MSSSHSFRRGSCSSTQPHAPLNPRRARYVDGTVDDCYLAEVEDNLSPHTSDTKSRSAVNHPSTSTHTPPSPPQARPPKRSKQSKRTSSPKDESKSPFPAVDVDYSEYALGIEPCSDSDEREDENDGNASYYSHSDSESCGPHTPNSDAEPNHYPHNYAYAPAPYSSPYLHPYYHWNHAAFQPYASYNANYDTNLNAGRYYDGSAGQWGNMATNMIAQLCGNVSSTILSSDSGMTHGNTFSNIGNNNSKVIFGDEEEKKRERKSRKGTKTDSWR